MQKTHKKIYALLFMVLLITSAAIALTAYTIKTVNATTYPDRDTVTDVSAAPQLIGLGQNLTVSTMVWPAPMGPTWLGGNTTATTTASRAVYGYVGVSVTFTKPDGTNVTFEPTDVTLLNIGVNIPGQTEVMGTLLFYYAPDEVGNWSVTASFPGNTFTAPSPKMANDTVYCKPSHSPTRTFTVQKEPVNSGMANGWPWSALPTEYWTAPVSPNNREWYIISGNWIGGSINVYNTYLTAFNAYSTAPNEPHIVWTRQVNLGGLIGGDWGSESYSTYLYGTGGGSLIILQNRLFHNNADKQTFSCVDLVTGKLIYTAPGQITFLQDKNTFFQTATQSAGSEATIGSYLWDISSTAGQWKVIDPQSGAILQTITNVPTNLDCKWMEGEKSNIFFVTQKWGWNTTIPLGYAGAYLIRWNSSMVTNNDWATGLMWNVSIRQPNGVSVGDGKLSLQIWEFTADNVLIISGNNYEGRFMGFDATTGSWLYTVNMTFIPARWYMGNPDGPFMAWNDITSGLVAFDPKTGNVSWNTANIASSDSPWGVLPPSCLIVAYDNIYLPCFDGYVYAVNLSNGTVMWKSTYLGSTAETPYGTWEAAATGGGVVGADGKLYIGTDPVYNQQPASRYNSLYCFNASTGQLLWKLPFVVGRQGFAVAMGYLVGTSEDGFMYCFGKGQTSTSISTGNTVIANGEMVEIQGSVLDQSPAQPGTPAVSDSSMVEWMDYLHMQNATLINSPPTPQGVQVTLTALDANNNIEIIGTTTTNGDGNYVVDWTPPIPGIMQITATFAGTNSYWSSSAETALTVNPATISAASPQPVQAQPTGMYIGVAAVAIIIAIAIVGAVIIVVLRKRP